MFYLCVFTAYCKYVCRQMRLWLQMTHGQAQFKIFHTHHNNGPIHHQQSSSCSLEKSLCLSRFIQSFISQVFIASPKPEEITAYLMIFLCSKPNKYHLHPAVCLNHSAIPRQPDAIRSTVLILVVNRWFCPLKTSCIFIKDEDKK